MPRARSSDIDAPTPPNPSMATSPRHSVGTGGNGEILKPAIPRLPAMMQATANAKPTSATYVPPPTGPLPFDVSAVFTTDENEFGFGGCGATITYLCLPIISTIVATSISAPGM